MLTSSLMGPSAHRSLHTLASDYTCHDVLRIWRILEKEERCVVLRSLFCIPHKFSCDDLRNYKLLSTVVFLQICSSCRNQQQPLSPAHQPQIWADPGSPAFLSPSRNIRVAILPCSESTTCLFRTRPLDASDALVFNEVFWVSMSYPALHQKTLRVDVCTTDRSHLEECLVRAVSVCLSSLSYWGLIHSTLQGEGRLGENRL